MLGAVIGDTVGSVYEFTRILEAVGERTDYGKFCGATGIPR